VYEDMNVRCLISHENLIRLWDFATKLVNKKSQDFQDRKLDRYNKIVNTFESFKGQFVVNELTNYQFDWKIYLGGDNKTDGKVNGTRYEVKANITYSYPKADLMMWKKQPIVAPLIIMTAMVPYGYGRYVDICGYITLKEFKEVSVKNDKYWKVNCTKLHPVKELFA